MSDEITLVFNDCNIPIVLKDQKIIDKIPLLKRALNPYNFEEKTKDYKGPPEPFNINFRKRVGEFIFGHLLEYNPPEYGDIEITPEHYRESNMSDLDELKEILNLSIFLECDDFTRCIGFVIAKKLNKMKIEEIADFCGFSSPAPHRSLLLEDIHKSVEESN